MDNNNYRFQVNLGGMIEILSDHLYSSPNVYIRELLQNGADAITAKAKWINERQSVEDLEDNTFESGLGNNKENSQNDGCIRLEIEEGRRLTFTDNGLGLTEDEIHRFLAIIGESSKRGLEDSSLRSDYIGRFGIGLLSCFMVSDEIRILTRSCKSEDAPILDWQGRPDGTYGIRAVDGGAETADMPQSGTRVILCAKKGREEYFTKETIRKLLIYYGMLLPFPVIIRQNGEEEQLNPVYLPWEGRKTNKDELMLFGQVMFEEGFFDCVPFSSEQGGVSGVAYILNHSVLPSAKGSHRIYLKNMLLTESGEGILPDWAVFTRCIINSTLLRPTASREGFYADKELEQARDAIEESLISYIEGLAQNSPQMLEKFFKLHYLTLTSLALESPKLFKIFIDYYEFETTRGRRTGYELRMGKEPLVYAPTAGKYKQLSQLFFAQDKLLINVTYVHSLDLLETLGETYGLEVSAVEDWSVEELMEELSPDEQDEVFDFVKAADRILMAYDCRAEVKHFSPYQQPTFYLVDENAVFLRQVNESRAQASSMFFNMLDAFKEETAAKTAAALYFNYSSPLVRRLASCGDESQWRIFVEILYVQALQIAGFTLHNNELGMLNRNILLLMERGLSDV